MVSYLLWQNTYSNLKAIKYDTETATITVPNHLWWSFSQIVVNNFRKKSIIYDWQCFKYFFDKYYILAN